jgi:hypothetical protein
LDGSVHDRIVHGLDEWRAATLPWRQAWAHRRRISLRFW